MIIKTFYFFFTKKKGKNTTKNDEEMLNLLRKNAQDIIKKLPGAKTIHQYKNQIL